VFFNIFQAFQNNDLIYDKYVKTRGTGIFNASFHPPSDGTVKVKAMVIDNGKTTSEALITVIATQAWMPAILITIFIAASIGTIVFFVLLTLGMQVYSTTLGLRASQIEELLKNMIGEPTIQFEATVGIFVTASGDILTTQVGRFWLMISLFIIIVGVAPIIISLLYGFMVFYNNIGYFVWAIVGLDMFVGVATFYLGYRFFFKRGWERLKLSI
jgi:hypothetical protein